MQRGVWFSRVIGSGLIGLVLASAAFAQTPPPPTPSQGPPFGLPGSAPPPFSKGQGLGPGGKALAHVSYSCLGVVDSVEDAGSPFAHIDDALDASSGASTVLLAV